MATQNAFKGRAVVRSVFLIPYVLPTFVVATVWRTMFQPGGIVDNALNGIGIGAGLWLNGPTSYWTLIIVQIWASWPFIYLLALSGLQSVDHEVHEASALDGALWWNKLRYVVFPYLKGPLSLAFLIGMLHHINNFTLPFVLFGLPAPSRRRRAADADLRHELPEFPLRSQRSDGLRLTGAHRHPAVRLPARRQAR